MLVANSFDLWQKDIFFSAAEEVQQSADIMESSYRTWLRAQRKGRTSDHFDELTRELQMTLGTAKWQLEEFERAVRMSYRSHGDDITISRHGQFVSALEDQISLVEAELKESFEVEREQEFRWVNLDEEERDDFALFLSRNSETSQTITDKAASTSILGKKKNAKEDSKPRSEDSSIIQILNQGKCLQEVVTNSEEPNCFVDQEQSRLLETGDDVIFQADRIGSNHRTWGSPQRSFLEIVIENDGTHKNALAESTPKEKGLISFFFNSKGDNHLGAKRVVSSCTKLKMINCINQQLRGGYKSQRQQQMSPVLPVNSIRFVLALMLTIFIAVPFLVYST